MTACSSVILFIVAKGTGLVRIARATKPLQLFARMAGDSPVSLTVVKTVPGGHRELLELRLRWRAHRARGHWYHLDGIGAELEQLENVELDLVHNRCPRCCRVRDLLESRAEQRGRYCISCSQKHRFERMTPDEVEAVTGNILQPAARERGRQNRMAHVAAVRERNARCTVCRASLPVRSSNKLAAAAPRRCRSCAMRGNANASRNDGPSNAVAKSDTPSSKRRPGT